MMANLAFANAPAFDCFGAHSGHRRRNVRNLGPGRPVLAEPRLPGGGKAQFDLKGH